MKRKKTRRYISGMIVAVLLFLLCVVQNVNAEDVPAGSELPRLVDDADILTDSEEKELNQQLDTVSEEQECDVIIVTVDSLNGKTVEEYADDYYDDNGYGYGENDSGILFLVAMDDRGMEYIYKWRCDHGVYGCRDCIHGRPVRTRSE